MDCSTESTICKHPIYTRHGTVPNGKVCYVQDSARCFWKEKKLQNSNGYTCVKGPSHSSDSRAAKNFNIPFGRFRYECIQSEIVPKDMNVCFINAESPEAKKYDFSNLHLVPKGKTSEDVQNRKQQGESQGKRIIELNASGKNIKTYAAIREVVRELNMHNRQYIVKKMNSENGKGIYVKDGRKFSWADDPDLDGEEWKTIFISKDDKTILENSDGKECTKLYVSTFGRITSDVTNKWYGTSQPNGYIVTKIFGKTFFIHKLVATAFLGIPPKEGMTVNHKDKNPQNNRIENLEWMTQSEQNLHGWGKYYKLTHKDTNESHIFLGRKAASDFLREQNISNNENESTFSTALTRCKKRKSYIGKVWYPECTTQEEYERCKKRKIE